MIPFSSQQPPHTPPTTATPGWRERGGDRAAELDLGSMMMMKGPVSAINKTMALALLEQQGIHHGRGGPVLRTPRGGTMRVELIGHFKPCMTDIYLHI